MKKILNVLLMLTFITSLGYGKERCPSHLDFIDVKENVLDDKETCEDCVNLFGVVVLGVEECKAEFVLDYNFQCEGMTLIGHKWDFGDGTTTSGGFNITHTYTANGTYTVTGSLIFTLSDGTECRLEATTEVVINDCGESCEDCGNLLGVVVLGVEECKAEFVLDYNFQCEGMTLIGHEWDFGDGSIITGGFNITHTYASNGTYTVTGALIYTLSDGTECRLEATTEVVITDCGESCEDCGNLLGVVVLGVEECKAEFVLDYNFQCQGMTLIGHEWDFGDGTIVSGGFNITHTYASNGTYTVTGALIYTLSDGTECRLEATTEVVITDCGESCEGCANLFGVVVLGVEECKAEFVLDYNFQCEGMTLIGHEWDFGDGSTATGGFNVSHTYNSNGTYTVTGTLIFTLADGTECRLEEKTEVVIEDCKNCDNCVNLLGIVIDGIDGCNASLVLDYNVQCPGVSILSHDWNFGDGNTASGGFLINHTYGSNGTYTATGTITFTYNGETCEVSASTIVHIVDCDEEDCLTTAPTGLACQYFGNQLQLLWDPVPGATCYVISIEPDDSNPNTKKCCKIPNAFQPFAVSVTTNQVNASPNWPACYRWRVRACCGNFTYGPFSTYKCQSSNTNCPIVGLQSQDEITDRSLNTLADGFINVYPNPSHEKFTITTEVQSETSISYSITDQTGKLLFDRNVKNVSIGLYQETWSPSQDVPNGIYFLTVKIGKDIKHSKLILQR